MLPSAMDGRSTPPRTRSPVTIPSTPPTEGEPTPPETKPTEGMPDGTTESDLDKARRQAAHWQKAARDHEKAAKTTADKVAELETANATDAEKAVAKARAEGAAEAEATWKTRWHAERGTTEALTALTPKVRNPRLLLPHLDMSVVQVADDGAIDSTALAAAVDALLELFPGQKLTTNPGTDGSVRARTARPARADRSRPSAARPVGRRYRDMCPTRSCSSRTTPRSSSSSRSASPTRATR